MVNGMKIENKSVLKKSKKEFILNIINSIVLRGAVLIIPVIWSYALDNIYEASYDRAIKLIVLSIIITTMASFVPIPGASGGMEYGFIALFSYYVLDVKLGAVMLIWRFLTYYLLVIFGGILFAFEGRE